MNLWALVAIIFTIFGLGGGGFYLLYLRSRPKKESWTAYVYQLSSGIQPKIKDRKGNIIADFKLKDLKPYGKDVVTKNILKGGKEIYKLERLNMSVGTINSADIDYFGKEKIVNILVDNGKATVLRKGYDEATGSQIFSPIPREDVELITSKIALHKLRLNKKVDVLGKVLSYVVVGLSLLCIVAISYINVNGSIQLAKDLNDNIKSVEKMQKEIIEQSREFLKESQNLHAESIKIQKQIIAENQKQLSTIQNFYINDLYNLSTVK